MQFENTHDFAQNLDNNDLLKSFRSRFFIPQHSGNDCVYFTGNSLGLQPKSAIDKLKQELDDWAKLGVEGHFDGKNPWFHYHKFFAESSAKIVGAKPEEVVVMNNLTVNLHLMMVSFYRPTKNRYKIIMEAGAFPSDQYAMESQAKFHGFKYEEAVVEVSPRDGEHHLRTEDILQTIEKHGDSVALVMFSGVQYYTGQAFDMAKITQKAHEVGALAGFDLAHAAGNLVLKLHDWDVDFAVWCSYKYLNSGPGGVSGAFVHERHAQNADLPRFCGWWGHKESERFLMKKGFIPEYGAAGWQLSNAPVMSMAVHRASLDIFDEVSMEQLNQKSKLLNAFLQYVVEDAARNNDKLSFEIITPEERGCQLSVLTGSNGKQLFDYLTKNGVIADWREPNVIRMAPVPLYNSFMDVYRFGEILKSF
ncbi:MAG: kynureninase [Flavobacteriales bacterium]|nr:kynureninase [Flavobacteriales bacterium]